MTSPLERAEILVANADQAWRVLRDSPNRALARLAHLERLAAIDNLQRVLQRARHRAAYLREVVRA